MLNKKGLTLVEVLIALVITLVLFLALMQSALLSISVNVNNSIRNEAVRIAEMRMIELRNTSFDDLTTPDPPDDPTVISRNFRNFSIDFTSTDTITSLPAANPTAKQIQVSIAWTFKGENHTHSITTIKRRT